VAGKVTFDLADVVVVPGETIACTIELRQLVPVSEGQAFDVVEGKRTVGHGVVRLVL
jgi:translation elongation factor EF-Tu-like GTPase